jgi:hypothetical protein
VLIGAQGCGKGALFENFYEMLKPHSLHTTKPDDVVGRFNGHLKDKIFQFADEGTFSNDRDKAGIIKGLITNKYINIEAKYQDSYMVRSHLNLAIASNSMQVVPASDKERRFVVIDVSHEKVGDGKYFEALFNQMDSGGRLAMLYDLERWDYSGVNLRSIPTTDALVDQIIPNLSPFHRFWHNALWNESVCNYDPDIWKKGSIQPSLEKMYADYITFADNLRLNYRESSSTFSRLLNDTFGKLESSRKRVNDENEESDKRINVKTIPKLNDCREKFEKFIGKKIDWPS